MLISIGTRKDNFIKIYTQLLVIYNVQRNLHNILQLIY